MKHTPGPWRVGGEEAGWAQNCAIIGPSGVIIAETVHASAEEEAGNLRLMATAPELIAAALFAEDILDAHLRGALGRYGTSELTKAHAALEKAIKKAGVEADDAAAH